MYTVQNHDHMISNLENFIITNLLSMSDDLILIGNNEEGKFLIPDSFTKHFF
jgi:hypothetical protein